MNTQLKFGQSISSIDVKRSAGTGEMTFVGYGSTFGNVDAYGDTIARGAFQDAVSKARFRDQYPAMLLQHGGMLSTAADMTPVGIWLTIEEDDKGLRLQGKLADTPVGRALWALMTMTPRSAIQGLSIGFRMLDSDKTKLPLGATRRITRVDLLEVSIVTFPADSFAQISGVGSPESADRSELVTNNLVASIMKLYEVAPEDMRGDAASYIRRLAAAFKS